MPPYFRGAFILGIHTFLHIVPMNEADLAPKKVCFGETHPLVLQNKNPTGATQEARAKVSVEARVWQ